MITPASMELLSFVVLKDKVEEVSQRLLKLGTFHPVDIQDIEHKINGLTSAQIDKENQVLETLQTRIRDITRKLKLQSVFFCEKNIQEFSSIPDFALGFEENGLISCQDKACEQKNRRRIQCNTPRTLLRAERSNDKKLETFYRNSNANSGIIQIQQYLDRLDQEVTPFLEKKGQLQEELVTNETILRQVREYFPFAFEHKSFYSFLEVSTGKIEEKNIPVLERSLQGLPRVIHPFRKENSRVLVLLIGLRRDRALIEKVLKDVSWEEVDFPKGSDHLSEDAQKELICKIEEGKKKIRGIEENIKQIGLIGKEDLFRARSSVNLRKSLLEAQRYSCFTEKTVLFSGWVPREKKSEIISEIKLMGEICYLESKSPEELKIPQEEVPVNFQHGPLVKPFEMLISAYGIPRYGTIDPTIFVAVSFLIMFGAMFGDIGHGMFLVFIGLFLAFKKSPAAVMNRQVSALLFYCGASSMIFGALYGSVFGFDFNSFWFKPMNNIMQIFRAGIFLGIAMISLGIIINVINAFRDCDYAKAVFDKAGLIGGVVYWAGIGLVSKMFFSQEKVIPLYFFLIFGGLLVLFLYPIIDNLFIRKHGGVLESFMESIVNILEIFMGYLSNTVSFIRVAAFALAHAGLFLAIFTLSRLINPHTGAGTFLSWMIIILGNILVVCLEGLIVSIQSLRLNYYEFFSKFFISGKCKYKPLTL